MEAVLRCRPLCKMRGEQGTIYRYIYIYIYLNIVAGQINLEVNLVVVV